MSENALEDTFYPFGGTLRQSLMIFGNICTREEDFFAQENIGENLMQASLTSIYVAPSQQGSLRIMTRSINGPKTDRDHAFQSDSQIWNQFWIH